MKTSVLLAVAIGLFVAGIFTRQAAVNHTRTLVNQVVAADASGQDTTAQLASLKKYIDGHMGTSARFELGGAYSRAQAAAQGASQPQVSGDVYAQAQAACAGLKIAVQQAQCNENYLNSHLTQAQSTPVAAPNEQDYQYHWQAPLWTPDDTGYLWLLSIVGVLVGAGLLVFRR